MLSLLVTYLLSTRHSASVVDGKMLAPGSYFIFYKKAINRVSRRSRVGKKKLTLSPLAMDFPLKVYLVESVRVAIRVREFTDPDRF